MIKKFLLKNIYTNKLAQLLANVVVFDAFNQSFNNVRFYLNHI